MYLYFALVVSGIALLVWSADRFTDGAAAIARNFGVAPLIVGLTIVAIGSSAPEIVVSFNAALNGNGELGLGNALGSNITNIAFVLGITALVKPLTVDSSTLRREFPLLLIIALWATWLLEDGQLTAQESWPLVIALFFYVGWLIRTGLKTRVKSDLMLQEIVEELPESMSNVKAFFWLIIGLILLQISSRMLVYGAEHIALHFGISHIVIGSTIIAIGTSLPELAASVAGVLKDEDEMALGNVIGSNIFNVLAVMSIPGIMVGVEFGPEIFYRDGLFMVALTVAMGLMSYGFRGAKGRINRVEGFILLSSFFGWLALVTIQELNRI